MSMIVIDEPSEAVATSQIPVFAKDIDRLYHKGATTHLARILDKLLPADIAQILATFHDNQQAKDVFDLITSQCGDWPPAISGSAIM